MADDPYARIAELEAEVAATRQREAVLLAENAGLRDDNTSLRTTSAEALEQQTATAEILAVIAASPADLTRVLQAIVDTATRLTESDGAGLQQAHDGHLKPIVESGHTVVASAASLAAGYPGPLLVLHAAHDQHLDRTHADRLHAWGGGRDKRLVIFLQGNHNTILSANFQEYLREVTEFLNRVGVACARGA